MQNSQYETFAEHFKNGTVTSYNSFIDRNEIYSCNSTVPINIDNNLVTFKFDMKSLQYEGSFTIIANSESACISKATEILNKLMN